MKLTNRIVKRLINQLIDENDILRRRPTTAHYDMLALERDRLMDERDDGLFQIDQYDKQVDELEKTVAGMRGTIVELNARPPVKAQFLDRDVDYALWQIEHYSQAHVPIDVVRQWADIIRGNRPLATQRYFGDKPWTRAEAQKRLNRMSAEVLPSVLEAAAMMSDREDGAGY